MPFLQHNYYKKSKAIPSFLNKCKSKIKYRDVDRNSAQKAYLNSIHTFCCKRAFCRPALSGSMTVEAALAVPLLLSAWIACISLISVVRVQEKVSHTLADVGAALAVEAGEDLSVVRSGWLLKAGAAVMRLEDMRGGGIYSVSGFNFAGSQVLANDEWICLEVAYRVKLMTVLIPLPDIKLKSYVKVRAWTGYIPGEDRTAGETMHHYVYRSEYGRVYHENRLCSHIKLKIYMADRAEALKYPPCEKCGGKDNALSATFYLSETGECYHTRLGCSGLKRSVERMEKKEALVSGLFPCQRCTAGVEGEE